MSLFPIWGGSSAARSEAIISAEERPSFPAFTGIDAGLSYGSYTGDLVPGYPIYQVVHRSDTNTLDVRLTGNCLTQVSAFSSFVIVGVETYLLANATQGRPSFESGRTVISFNATAFMADGVDYTCYFQ